MWVSRIAPARGPGRHHPHAPARGHPDLHETADGTLYVTVLTTSPAVGCVTTQMMTSPSAAVSLERRDAEVVFVERELVLQC